MSADSDLRSIGLIVKALDAKKAGDIVVLDLREQSSYLNYFVLATALSRAHLKPLFDEIHRTAVENGIERPRAQSPQYESGWVTYDFGFYVIHLFEEEKRKFYNLEGIWKNATRVSLLPVVRADSPAATGSSQKLQTSSTDLTPRKGESKSEKAPKKAVKKKTTKTSVKPESFSKKKTTIKKKTTKEINMATAKKKPAKKKAAKKTAKKKTAKKK